MATEAGRQKILAIWAGKRGYTDDEVLTEIRAGQTLEAICIKFECNAGIVHRVCERHGLPKFPRRKRITPWTDSRIAVLCQGWADGKTTAAIARELGMNKNQVVGKASRLDLQLRPNPVVPDPPQSPPRLRLRSARKPPQTPKSPDVLPALPVYRPRVAPRPRIVAPPPPPPTPIPKHGKVCECTWPIGEPRTRGFHFCDADSEPGAPYCTEHMRARRLVAA
jgi:GcrA cell cycle regulator